MAPKQQFTRSDIIDASFSVVRKKGWKALSARAIASELNASTRPIYDHLESMKHIEAEVAKKALAFFVDFIGQERTGDKWLDQALGYVIFASKEKHLFRCIFNEEHILMHKKDRKEHWKALGEQLSSDERFDGLPEEIKNRIRITRWFLVHGLASLMNTGWYALSESEDSILWEQNSVKLSTLLGKVNHGLYEEFKS